MTDISIVVAESAAVIDREAWGRLCPAGHPFLNADFLAILERHGAAGRRWGWRAQHLVAEDSAGSVLGLLPLYLKSHSHGEFIHDWSWAAAWRQMGLDYYPKAFSGLPHTPAAGPRLLTAPGQEQHRIREELVAAAKALVEDYGLSSWHVAFPAKEESAVLEAGGLVASHDVQFQWVDRGYGDFDGYLATFQSEKRRKVRAERRRVAESGLVIDVRHGDEMEPEEWPDLHALYASTFDKFGNHAAFSAACLAELAVALGRRMVLFVAGAQGEPVAVSICFRSDQVLYGRYWGCLGDYHSLHFELCFYQGIAYCLREGLLRFEPGAGGEHKLARGFTPTVVRSLHWIADPRLRRLLGQHLERQHFGVEAYREEASSHLPFRSEPGGGEG